MTEKREERVYIIKPLYQKFDDPSLDEITALVESAGASVVGAKIQILKEITPATFIGSGKLQERAFHIPKTVSGKPFQQEAHHADHPEKQSDSGGGEIR